MKPSNLSLLGGLAAALFISSQVAAHAAETAVADPVVDTRLASCLERARIDPPAARAAAEKWLSDDNGGEPAALCVAMAQFHDGAFADAAERLTRLAEAQPPERVAAAARLLGQAGWARLRGGAADAADKLYGDALKLTPGDVDLWIDRAFARAEAERFWDAVADLEEAMKLAPQRAEPHLYRAAAYKALGQPRAALEDLERALELRPDDPQALLLRGNLKAESGDWVGAEADWTLAARLDKDGGFGRSASDNLEKLRRGSGK